MKIFYRIYQLCIVLPIFLVLTLLTALTTIVGSLIGGAHVWGYYPGKIWSQLTCRLLLLPVRVTGREKLDKHIQGYREKQKRILDTEMLALLLT